MALHDVQVRQVEQQFLDLGDVVAAAGAGQRPGVGVGAVDADAEGAAPQDALLKPQNFHRSGSSWSSRRWTSPPAARAPTEDP
ncbi:hypothetical protein ACFXKC_46085 [Streptomyces sp. NPDC059340]|uniref:hypothetical protein n=1 Tax=Streptomyces sp. NPDC059340 TaxID=3346806 RepID=UPI0036B9F219